MRDILFWVWVAFGIWACYQFIVMAIPKVEEVHKLGKKRAWLLDSRISHKMAELLIWIPFYFIVLWVINHPEQEVLPLIEGSEMFMVAGGLLAAFSWFDAKGKYWWANVIWLLAAWGIFGGWIARNWILPFAGT
ncbi:MAG: hypothetical protein HKN16_03990 [Saprospiraceae bacterium]|nr:hypothetical protein [Saprospiraceae bacterium]